MIALVKANLIYLVGYLLIPVGMALITLVLRFFGIPSPFDLSFALEDLLGFLAYLSFYGSLVLFSMVLLLIVFWVVEYFLLVRSPDRRLHRILFWEFVMLSLPLVAVILLNGSFSHPKEGFLYLYLLGIIAGCQYAKYRYLLHYLDSVRGSRL